MQEKFPATNFYQASTNSVFASISADEFCTRIYHEFPAICVLPGFSCNTTAETVVLSVTLTITLGLAIVFAAVQGKNFIKDLTKPACKFLTLPSVPGSSNPMVIAKFNEVRLQQSQGLPIATVTGGYITSSGLGTAVFTDLLSVQINNLNLQGVQPFMDTVTEEAAVFNIQQEFNSQFNSGSIFRLPVLITKDYTHTQFDGEVFIIDATASDITVIIPVGDVSNSRIFEYKRLDRSSHKVVISSPGLIDGRRRIRLSNRKCKISAVRLVGYNGQILVLSHSTSINPV